MKTKKDGRLSKKELTQAIEKLRQKSLIKEALAAQICDAIQEAAVRKKELQAILNGSKAVLEEKGFTESARSIFDYCRNLIGAASGYVALLSDTGEENEVLFLESGGLPCDVDPDLPMPVRGLRAEAYHFKSAVYHNDFMHSRWVKFMPDGHVALKNVMFAPLILDGKAVGLIGLANKDGDFNDNDAEMATGFGELAAIALQNSNNLDERITSEKQRETVIRDLKQALAQVKKLSGLLPICMHCKKIRDDKGYWNQLEEYITNHSEAGFSHSICDACMNEHYSDLS